MKVLLCGGSGFVGRHIQQTLSDDLFVAGRAPIKHMAADRQISIDNFNQHTPWNELFPAVDVVITTIARVPEPGSPPLSLDDYKEVNLHGTINLAQVAAAKGVKRFVFLSSIKVNGEFTRAGQIFSGSDTPHPTDNYGISKLKTEEALLKLAGETGMEVSIIRPPLVYGAAVKGNFRQLLSCIYKGWPLPLASIAAKRSYINLNNLVSLIEICMTHPMAANRVFTVSDNEDISIADLVNRMAFQLGVKPRLLPFPSKLLEVAGVIFRKEPITQRLCKPLLVDVTDAKRLLGWLPNTSVDQGLGDAAKWYLEEQTEALRPSMMRVN